MFDRDLQRGVKKKDLPPPRVMELAKSSTLEEVLLADKSIFFTDIEDSLSSFAIADSGGIPFEILDPEDWILSEFIKEQGIQPSKLRLYILHHPEVGTEYVMVGKNVIIVACMSTGCLG